MANSLRRLLSSEHGGMAVEYALIAALISLSLIAGAIVTGNEVGNMFNDVGSELVKANK